MGESETSSGTAAGGRRRKATGAFGARGLRSAFRMLSGTAVAALVIGLVGSPGLAAGASYGFSRAVKVSAPSNASHNPQAWSHGVWCTSPGNCTTVGDYIDGSGHQQAMAATETKAKWARAVEIDAPTNAAKSPDASLEGISCPSAGNCTAVGTYVDSSGRHEAMAATEAKGKWGRAAEEGLPAGTSANPYGDLEAVSCNSAGNCTAVGNYTNGSGSQVIIAATETNAKWARATAVSLPVDAGTGSSAIAALFQVSCPAKGDCTAVGLYSDSSHDRRAIVVTETGGKWGRAAGLALLPTGASGTWSSLFGVWCGSVGSCTAVGAYEDDSSASHAMMATEVAGKWGKATELSLPPGANAQYPNAELEAVSCTSTGNCAASGAYSNTASYSFDMVAIETNGKWARAVQLSPPSGSRGTNTILGGSGNSVGCTKKGACTAVGSYGDGAGNNQAMAAAGTV